MGNYVPTKFMAEDSHYDQEKADRAVNFIKCLKHTKGVFAGKPFELLPWQEQIIRDVFGVIKSNGYRQFNYVYVEIPKKNGKSELAAAIALYLLCADNEPSGEVYSAAADRNQAAIVAGVAMDMVRNNPALMKRCKVLGAQKRIVFNPTRSIYQVLSAEVGTKHGLNVSGVIFDELHAQPNRNLYDVLVQGSGDARTQPLYFFITTAGNDRNSICYEIHQKAQDLIQGRKQDFTWYPVIYGIEDTDDWTSEDVWYKANPSLDHTIHIDKVRVACESAKQNPAEENAFRQLRLNQWVAQNTRWLPMAEYDKCTTKIDENSLVGKTCYLGLDLASTTDLCAAVIIFPPDDDYEKFIAIPYIFIPKDTIKLRSKRDHVMYDLWEKQGHIIATEGNVVDYRYLKQFIINLRDKFNIAEICYDRWNASMLVQELEDEGVATMVPMGQGFASMSSPTKDLMKMTLDGNIVYQDNPCMRWCFDNISIRQDPAGNIKIDKAKSTERVDVAVACVMALDRAIRNESNKSSVYDERGLLVL